MKENLLLKSVHINKLDDIVNKYKNTSHSTIKMKPANVTSSTYIDFGVENNYKTLNSELVTM